MCVVRSAVFVKYALTLAFRKDVETRLSRRPASAAARFATRASFRNARVALDHTEPLGWAAQSGQRARFHASFEDILYFSRDGAGTNRGLRALSFLAFKDNVKNIL